MSLYFFTLCTQLTHNGENMPVPTFHSPINLCCVWILYSKFGHDSINLVSVPVHKTRAAEQILPLRRNTPQQLTVL